MHCTVTDCGPSVSADKCYRVTNHGRIVKSCDFHEPMTGERDLTKANEKRLK